MAEAEKVVVGRAVGYLRGVGRGDGEGGLSDGEGAGNEGEAVVRGSERADWWR